MTEDRVVVILVVCTRLKFGMTDHRAVDLQAQEKERVLSLFKRPDRSEAGDDLYSLSLLVL